MPAKRTIVFAIILTLAAIGEVVLAFVLYRDPGHTLLRNLGWVVLWTAAIFGSLPILMLKRWGGVSPGQGYIHTTRLVDRGLYAVVRHPQYLSFILIALGLAMIAQHWLPALLGAIVIVLSYLLTLEEDRSLREKFGPAYERYSQAVPRLNFVLGIMRRLMRR
ncbi:MAG: isoprenylcysteine carboxylmethyltransferase family protein [Chloroflexia bacterium]|nr:isoprenylcysteine carboxylmethyltransferase family protein [Chloroflexia bacterium]